jgi:hypothetical protein
MTAVVARGCRIMKLPNSTYFYLAVILDAWSRWVIGYTLNRQINIGLPGQHCGLRLKIVRYHPDAFIIRTAVHSMQLNLIVGN